MKKTTAIDIMNALQAPLPKEELEWRIGRAGQSGGKVWAKALAYVTARGIQRVLDETVGPFGWQNEFTSGPGGGILCGISLRDPETGNWVTKWDGAENTKVESVKGGLSDSVKRAAVSWGIGRYLYKLDETFVGEISMSPQYGPEWNYAPESKGKHPAFYWKSPYDKLPAWALPQGAPASATPRQVPPSAPAQASAPSPEAHPTPAAEPPKAAASDAGETVVVGPCYECGRVEGHNPGCSIRIGELNAPPRSAAESGKQSWDVVADIQACSNLKHLENIWKKYQAQAKNEDWYEALKGNVNKRKAEIEETLGKPPATAYEGGV